MESSSSVEEFEMEGSGGLAVDFSRYGRHDNVQY